MSGNASMEKVLCVSVLVKFPRAETRAFLPQWKAGLTLNPGLPNLQGSKTSSQIRQLYNKGQKLPPVLYICPM